MLSIRSRLTAWNGGVIAVILLGFATSAYLLLQRASIEQVDQTVRQQLRSVMLTVGGETATAEDAPAAVARLAAELQKRGYSVATSPDYAYLTTRVTRSDRAEQESRARYELVVAGRKIVAPALLESLKSHSASLQNTRRAAFSAPGPEGGTRIIMREAMLGQSKVIIAATEPLNEVDELLGQARMILLIAIPIVLGLALAVGYLQARNALAPISAMTQQARHIGARNLHERLAVVNEHDELGELATTFNSVLDRIDRAMNQQHQFTADASHELRTPIAIIRSEADVTLDAGDRSVAEYRDTLAVIRDGSEQLSRIVEDLFLLARADAGESLPQRAPVYLDDLVADAVRSMRSLAAARRIDISVQSPEGLAYTADEKLLRRAIVNLLDNAVKYSPEQSSIVITVEQSATAYRIVVTDNGPGIPDSARALVFDRFYRVNLVRSRDVSAHGSGAGLGLAIAREIVELHGGQLILRGGADKLKSGATFEITLPQV